MNGQDPVLSDLIGVCAWSVGMFGLGYGWGLYRTVTWPRRMVRWASTFVASHERECDGC